MADTGDHSGASADITFRQIISPFSPEEFFGTIWDQRAVHIPGAAEKFVHAFSWEELNRLLNMSKLWSDRSMSIVIDGQIVDLAEYGRAGQTREGNQAIMPDPEQIKLLLRRGATMVLDLIETLSPGVATISAALQTATGGVAVCNVYCSWRAHQGFTAHCDSTDVFAMHIEGSKIWRVYQGRADNAVDIAGYDYASFTPEHHASAKGELLEEVEMKPGDVLYLPKGAVPRGAGVQRCQFASELWDRTAHRHRCDLAAAAVVARGVAVTEESSSFRSAPGPSRALARHRGPNT